ncbi:reverse transcriptase domain-containing protein [uncultured Rubinisphaera sp.]|uniref:reverse transcriptase domain-containing protein n=1 Tax=uncultured Rubinisphaera sp. TaxID=1678686 RepID=UPI000ED55F5A|nr:hypothetical protein [Planctomycetaceae bacterium]|tara:strand:+ start:700 stop:2178 length:1479 start_codon:yes stop_codon:yes gene_type:complete
MSHDAIPSGGRFRESQKHLDREALKHIRRQRQRNKKIREQVISNGPSYDISEVLPPLEWAFDVERLKNIFDDMIQYKGQAAGPDRIRMPELTQADRYSICRMVNRLVLNGTYRPSEQRQVKIPKSNGGFRTLNIGNVADRMVATVISKILTALVDKHFVSTSYAYRPNRGVYDLLARLSYAVAHEHKTFYFREDFQNAFDNVPIDLILEGLQVAGVDPSSVAVESAEQREQIFGQWRALIENVLRGAAGKSVGISQGCPLSPVAMNIFAHVNHDQVCKDIEPGVTAVRYSDDMFYLCASESMLADFRQQIGAHISQLGLTFKGDRHSDNTNLRPLNIYDTPLETMGFVMSMPHDSNPRFDIPESGYLNLIERLKETHGSSDPISSGSLLLTGWINSYGPAFSPCCKDVVKERILSSLNELKLNDSMSPERCLKLMQDSYSKWKQKQEEIFTTLRTPTVPQSPQETTTRVTTLPIATSAPQSLNFDDDDSCPF